MTKLDPEQTLPETYQTLPEELALSRSLIHHTITYNVSIVSDIVAPPI